MYTFKSWGFFFLFKLLLQFLIFLSMMFPTLFTTLVFDINIGNVTSFAYVLYNQLVEFEPKGKKC